MLGHRLNSKREKSSTPINRKLRVNNQSCTRKEQNETRDKKVNPRHPAQIQEEHKDLRGGESNKSDDQKIPMLKKCLQTVAFAAMLHSGLTYETEPQPTKDREPRSGTGSPNGCWLQCFVRHRVLVVCLCLHYFSCF